MERHSTPFLIAHCRLIATPWCGPPGAYGRFVIRLQALRPLSDTTRASILISPISRPSTNLFCSSTEPGVLSIFTFTGLHVLWLTIVFGGSMSLTAYGQDATRTIQEMKKLSLEELMNLEVTSASKHLPGNVELGATFRSVDELPEPYVSDYMALDVRIAWKIHRVLELSVVGQNLLQDSHTEFVSDSPTAKEIERSVYAKVVWVLSQKDGK
jgi:hypothetical protein